MTPQEKIHFENNVYAVCISDYIEWSGSDLEGYGGKTAMEGLHV
jgi:hypothetical protein